MWEMTLSSGNHILVMALPVGVVLFLLMVLNRRSHDLLIVVIIHWSLDVGDLFHGELVVLIVANFNQILLSGVKSVALIVLSSWMLYFLIILSRAACRSNRWTWHINISPKIILILDAVIYRDELLVALPLGHVRITGCVFVRLHCRSEWCLDVII